MAEEDGTTRPGYAALHVVLIYAAFAALWILLSDRAVEWMLDDPASIRLAHASKGWLFVAVTSLLLYTQMRRPSGASAPPIQTIRLGLPFALLAVVIAVLTGAAVAHTFKHQRETEVARLQAIAELKSREIGDWLRERQGDAAFVQTSTYFAEQYRGWRERGDPVSGGRLQTRLEQLRANRGFDAVTLLDSAGRRLWGTAAAPRAPAPQLLETVRAAALDGKVRRVGPYHGPEGQARLDFVAPLLSAGEPAPAIVLHVDPATWLYPALRAWPGPTTSGEALLFRRDGGDVVFLNDLRHRPDRLVNFAAPVSTARLLAARVLRGEAGQDGLVEGADYRGVPSLGMARPVPGTDWFLMAKLDRAELQGGAIAESAWIGLVGLLALFVAGAAVYLLRQRQELAVAARVQQAQAERLRALRLLAAIADSSDDSIFAQDREGRYILFNRAAERATGKSAAAVLGRDETVLLPAETVEMHRSANRRILEDGASDVIEETLPMAAGERVLLTSMGPLRDEDGRIVGLYGIVRDITELRRAELALREREAFIRSVLDNLPVGVGVSLAEPPVRFSYMNDNFARFYRTSRERLADPDAFWDAAYADPDLRRKMRERVLADCASGDAGRMHWGDVPITRPGEPTTYIAAHNIPLPDTRLMISMVWDVTERVEAEVALQEKEARFRTLFENAAVAILIHHPDSGEILEANRRAIESYGYDTLEELQRNGFCLDPPYGWEDALGLIRKAAAQGPQRFEWMNRDRHGRIFWEDVLLKSMALNGVERVLAVTIDITKRKHAEEGLQRYAEELEIRNAELERFNRLTVGRELDMIVLKRQVNELSERLGQPPPHRLAFSDAPADAPPGGERA